MAEQQPQRDVTSHWAVNEECCRKMASKYGWSLVETRRRIEAKDPLVVECIFEGDTQFPKNFMGFSGGRDR